MKTQPLLVIFAVFAGAVALLVGSAIALKMTDTPVSIVAGVASVLGGAIVALIGKASVFSQATTETLVTDALVKSPPTNPIAVAKEMVKEAK